MNNEKTAPETETETASQPEGAAETATQPEQDSAAARPQKRLADAEEVIEAADAESAEQGGESAASESAASESAEPESAELETAAPESDAPDASVQTQAGERETAGADGSDDAAAQGDAGEQAEAAAASTDAEPIEAKSGDDDSGDDGESDDDDDEDRGDEAQAEAAPEPEPEPDEALIARVRATFSQPGDGDSGAEGAAFRFARWAKPVAPRVFGVEPQSADTLMAGFRTVAEAAGARYAVEDERYGANVLVFVCSEWLELKATPKLEQLIPELDHLIAVLRNDGANQYRIFGYDEDGAIDLVVVLLRMDDALGALSAEAVALGEAVRCLVTWSDESFDREKPLRIAESGRASLKPYVEALLAASYAEDTPVASQDPALAESLARFVARRLAATPQQRGDGRRQSRKRRRGGQRRRRGDSNAEA